MEISSRFAASMNLKKYIFMYIVISSLIGRPVVGKSVICGLLNIEATNCPYKDIYNQENQSDLKSIA